MFIVNEKPSSLKKRNLSLIERFYFSTSFNNSICCNHGLPSTTSTTTTKTSSAESTNATSSSKNCWSQPSATGSITTTTLSATSDHTQYNPNNKKYKNDPTDTYSFASFTISFRSCVFARCCFHQCIHCAV